MQYTIRGIPPAVDAALRRRAKATSKSLNQVAIEALADGAGAALRPRKRRSATGIAGTWKEDKAFDEAIADHERIDDELWR